MSRFIDAANLLSLAGLSAAVLSALLAANGRVRFAIVALSVSGLCDLFDGALARRLDRSPQAKQFGAALDLVVDGCSFGIAPAVLLNGVGLRSAPEIALLVAFVCCAAWRLAYFETVGLVLEQDVRYYHGLPTTFVALIVPLACLAGFYGEAPLRVAAALAAGGLALAMVSPVRIPKPTGRVLLAFPVIGVIFILTFGFAPGFALP
jgi:CDP-diacylglycerol--serine O-phosphatidyltransferase